MSDYMKEYRIKNKDVLREKRDDKLRRKIFSEGQRKAILKKQCEKLRKYGSL